MKIKIEVTSMLLKMKQLSNYKSDLAVLKVWYSWCLGCYEWTSLTYKIAHYGIYKYSTSTTQTTFHVFISQH